MKRWFLLVTLTVALPVIALACGGDDDKGSSGATPTSTIDSGKSNPTSTATNTSPTGTSTTQPPTDGGADSGKRTGCLDRPPSDPRSSVERPDRLPCNLIPPGLTL